MIGLPKRLRASLRCDAINGDSFERSVCAKQMREAADSLERADARIAELEAEVAVLRVDANLHKQIHRAAELLPDRCEIQLTVENGSGWVELFTGHAWVEPSPDGDLAEQVSECIDRALEGDEARAGNGGGV